MVSLSADFWGWDSRLESIRIFWFTFWFRIALELIASNRPLKSSRSSSGLPVGSALNTGGFVFAKSALIPTLDSQVNTVLMTKFVDVTLLSVREKAILFQASIALNPVWTPMCIAVRIGRSESWISNWTRTKMANRSRTAKKCRVLAVFRTFRSPQDRAGISESRLVMRLCNRTDCWSSSNYIKVRSLDCRLLIGAVRELF